jgi:hypothetical protein
MIYRFDVKNANINDPNFETMKDEKIPDVVSELKKLMLRAVAHYTIDYSCLIRSLHSRCTVPVKRDQMTGSVCQDAPPPLLSMNCNLPLHQTCWCH